MFRLQTYTSPLLGPTAAPHSVMFVRSGGLVAIETPNPESLAIFATHFYLDPTHRHPLPPALLCFYLEEAGFGGIDVVRLNPTVESMPSVADLPREFREQFFGALDYAVFARKLG